MIKHAMKSLIPAALALLSACSMGVADKTTGATITTNTKSASISGHVYAADSVALARRVATVGPVLTNAVVTLTSGADTLGKFRTQADGVFRFDSLQAGVYGLHVSASNYATRDFVNIVLAPGQALTEEVVLEAVPHDTVVGSVDTSVHAVDTTSPWKVLSQGNPWLGSSASWAHLESHGNRIFGVYPGGASAFSTDGISWNVLANIQGELFFMGGDSILLWGSSAGYTEMSWRYTQNGTSWKQLYGDPGATVYSLWEGGRVPGFHHIGDSYYYLYSEPGSWRSEPIKLTKGFPLQAWTGVDTIPPAFYRPTSITDAENIEGSYDNGVRILQFISYADTAWDYNAPFVRYIAYTDADMKLHLQPGPSVGFADVVGDSLGWLALDSTGALQASADGLNWQVIPKPSGATMVNFIAVGDGKFLVGTDAGLCFTSSRSPGVWTTEWAPDFSFARSAVFHKGQWYVGGLYNSMLRRD